MFNDKYELINKIMNINMRKEELNEIIDKLYVVNESLRFENGLYKASVGCHYTNYCWLRDSYWQCKVNLKHNPEKYKQTYKTLLKYFKLLDKNYDDKLEWLLRGVDVNSMTFIHPRIYPNLEEITSQWANVQFDSISYILLGIVEGEKHGIKIIETEEDKEIIDKVIRVFEAIKYWQVESSDAWEEERRIRLSGIGSVVSAMKQLKSIGFTVPDVIITEGEKVIKNLYPKETYDREVDLAQLSLIYPFNILDEEQKDYIFKNVKKKLETELAHKRYLMDVYYNIANKQSLEFKGKYKEELHGIIAGNEPSWSFGNSFCYFCVNDNKEDADFYLKRVLKTIDIDGNIPELFYSDATVETLDFKKDANINNPLGWANAMAILVLEDYIERYL